MLLEELRSEVESDIEFYFLFYVSCPAFVEYSIAFYSNLIHCVGHKSVKFHTKAGTHHICEDDALG